MHSHVTIPLSKLQPSKANVRTTAAAEIDALAASIAAHGLLQNLTVTPVAKNGKTNGHYAVVAGARRLAALKKLAKAKKIPKDFEVPCAVVDDEARPQELSLAENVERLPLHPADQFDAFFRLHRDGLSAGEIAARFGIAERLVVQRLKLASVSSKLVELYRTDAMTLEQLMAFTVSDDHAAQERAWFENPYGHPSPHAIRRALTATLVEASDKRVRFVGAPAYEAAGGAIIRDLFSDTDNGWFADSALLDRLVADKLGEQAKTVEAEGWSWVEVLPELDYAAIARHGRIPAVDGLSDDERDRLDDLCDRYDALVEALDDDPSEDQTAELDELEGEIEALSKKREQWSESDKARAGALVSVGYDGGLEVVRGLVRPEEGLDDETADTEPRAREREKPKDGIPDALRETLSAHRTAALRAELIDRPNVAFSLLLYTLVCQLFFGGAETCLKVAVGQPDLSRHDGVGDGPAMVALAERHRAWAERMPAKDGLWDWLLRLEDEDESSLLALCVAMAIDAVRHKLDRADAPRLTDADRLAGALAFDMRQWWRAARETYFDHVSKDRILAAVAEAVSQQAADNIAGFKKPAMAARAEELVQATGWLPPPLRLDNGKAVDE